jgi:hypothetical protein
MDLRTRHEQRTPADEACRTMLAGRKIGAANPQANFCKLRQGVKSLQATFKNDLKESQIKLFKFKLNSPAPTSRDLSWEKSIQVSTIRAQSVLREGRTFQSTGDTAVILRALGLHGPSAVSWLRA